MQSAPALELRGLSRRFGAVTALDGASLVVERGTLHVLLGENGAGKTTMLCIAAGLERADAGEVIIDGQPRLRRTGTVGVPGIAVVAQHFSLIPAMTVAENVALGWRGTFAPFRPSDVARRVRDIAARTAFTVDPQALVASLSVAARQRVEILKAMAVDPHILVLDEPTAVLAPPEADELFAWLRRFVAAGGTAVVITHRLREALRFADAITVLRRGRTVLVTTATAATEPQIVSAIVGEAQAAPAQAPAVNRSRSVDAPVVLAAIKATVIRSGVAIVRDVSLDIRRGELVGVAGVEGAGQADLLRLFAGRIRPSRGAVSIPDRIGFIPEDRHGEALIGELSLRENFYLRNVGRRRGWIDWSAIDAETRAAIVAYDVRGGDPRSRADALSGGNQQRFVLAREIADEPLAIIAENPARGLDVRAAGIVHRRLQEACTRGAAVLWYSSDVDELLSVADRIVVCHAGHVREVAPTLQAVGAAMVSGA